MMNEKEMICCIEPNFRAITEFYEELSADYRITMILGTNVTWSSFEPFEEVRDIVDMRKKICTSKFGKRCRYIVADLHDYDMMMRVINRQVNRILKNGRKALLSIAGGTGEYCAAASAISMVYEDVTLVSRDYMDFPVKVGNDDENFSGIQFRQAVVIEEYKIPTPDVNLLRALRIYKEIPLGMRTSSNVIWRLLDDGVWYDLKGQKRPANKFEGSYFDNTSYDLNVELREKLMFNDRNFYKRKIFQRWVDEGWVEPCEKLSKTYDVSRKGMRAMYVFLVDDSDFDDRMTPDEVLEWIGKNKHMLHKGKEEEELEKILGKKILLDDLKD